MRLATIDILLLAFAFLALQVWWISMTIKQGKRGEVDKWGKRVVDNSREEIERTKKRLEKLFRL